MTDGPQGDQGQQTGGTGSGQGGQQQGQNGPQGQISGQGQQTGGTGSGGQGQQQGQAFGQPAGQQQGGQQTGGAGAEDVSSLPAWAQARLASLQREAGDARTNAKRTAAAEAEAAVIKRLGTALGLIKAEELTPDQLQERLTETTSRNRSLAIELAVLKTAPAAKGNAVALLDSRSFLAKIDKLDPSADGFADQVRAAIAQAVQENPLLGAGTPAGPSGGQINGGTGDSSSGEESMEDIQKRVRATRGRV